MDKDLTPEIVRKWFQSLSGNTNIYLTVDNQSLTYNREQVMAYVAKLETRVMRLASKLADQD